MIPSIKVFTAHLEKKNMMKVLQFHKLYKHQLARTIEDYE